MHVWIFGLVLLALAIDASHLRTKDEKNKRQEWEGRIIGGSHAGQKEFPFYVRLERPDGSLHCGGTLIASRWVLSAAHCDEVEVVAKVGVYIVDYNYGTFTKQIEARYVHPQYNDRTKLNDFQLLRLKEAIPDSIEPVTLNVDSKLDPRPGNSLITIGMGTESTATYSPSQVLQKVTLSAIDHDVCASIYGNRGLTIDEVSMICAAFMGGGKDSCAGDSGGPLLNSKGTQVGVVSWGIGCARQAYPGVYARVSSIVGWIQTIICDAKLLLHDGGLPPSICDGMVQADAPPPRAIVRPTRTSLLEELNNHHDHCDDAPPEQKFYVESLQGRRSCAWLAHVERGFIQNVCVPGNDAYDMCQETCGRCRDTCEDDPQRKFLVSPSVGFRGCKWLSKRSKRRERFCQENSRASRICQETCESCSRHT